MISITHPRLFFLLFLFTYCLTGCGQTLVNQSVFDTLGHPSRLFAYTRYQPLGGGNIAILANEYDMNMSPAAQAFYLVRANTDSGGITAGFDLHSLHGASDYGTALCTRSGYVYAVGFTTDSALGQSTSCTTIKLNAATWDTSWVITESLGRGTIQQAPFSVAADDYQNVYMGAAVLNPLSAQVTIVKYNHSGAKQWESSYDSTGYYTIPVAMAISGSTLVITGFSFNGISSDFITIHMSLSTGAILGIEYMANGTGTISHPVGIVTDTLRSSYIAGTAAVSGSATVIKLVKYDSLFARQYVQVYGDSTRSTQAAAICMDRPTPAGHIFITGTAPNASGGSDLLTLKYAPGGTLLWARTLSAPDPAHAMTGVGIVNDEEGNTFVTGSMYNGSDSDIVTAGYDTAGTLLWMKTYSRGTATNDVPYGITYNHGSSGLLVSVKSTGTDSLYLMLAYDQWKSSCTDTVCPTITYAFENGQITTAGLDSFVEFDIYAKQNVPALGYYGGNIIFTYSNDIFGSCVVDSSNIQITRGAITSDSNYIFSLTDTLFKSGIVHTDCSEVDLSISHLGYDSLYPIADTFQQLCHVKMKIAYLGNFKINFDQFFMQTQSLYLGSDVVAYTRVYTSSYLTLSGASNTDLTYSLGNITTNTSGAIPTVTFKVLLRASSDVPLADAGVIISYDPTVLSLRSSNNITLAGWVYNVYSSNSLTSAYEDIYFGTVQTGNGSITIEVDNNNEYNSSTIFDPSDNLVYHAITGSAVTYATITMDILDCVNPQISLSNSFNSDYAGSYNTNGYTLSDYNVVVGSSYTSALCVCKTSVDPCTGINITRTNIPTWNVYPNPFNQIFNIHADISEEAIVNISIENILGQIVYSKSYGSVFPSINDEINFHTDNNSGIYFVKLIVNGKEYIQKIIKE